MTSDPEDRRSRQFAGALRPQRAVEPELEPARGALQPIVPGRTTPTQGLAPGPSFLEARGALEHQLATAQRLLVALDAANRAADPYASCDAASRICSALHLAEAIVGRERAAQGARAGAMEAGVSEVREECRRALELAFTPSRAAIREAVDGTGRQHWDREVAAWRAARGYTEPVPVELAARMAERPRSTLGAHDLGALGFGGHGACPPVASSSPPARPPATTSVGHEAGGAVPPERPLEVAARALSGAGARLPYLDLVQASFGRHDISSVQAHRGDAAREAAGALGAHAFTAGDRVAFAEEPSLFTAAHEAAHVVQQRAGLRPAGEMDARGDALERHADAVAAAVVDGRSAEPLLDALVGSRGAAPAIGAVSPARGGGAIAVQRQAAPSPAPAPRPVLTLRLQGEADRARRPIHLSIAAEVLDVGGVIERVLASYGVPANRVKEIDHLAIAVDPAGSPGITKADAAAGAGVVLIAISPKLDAYLRDVAARMTATVEPTSTAGGARQPPAGSGARQSPADSGARRPPASSGTPGSGEPSRGGGGATRPPSGGRIEGDQPRPGGAGAGGTRQVPDRLKELLVGLPRAASPKDRETWDQVVAELLAMSDEDLTYFRILATHLTEDTARFLEAIRLYKKLKAQYLSVLEQALEEAAGEPGALEASRAVGPATPIDPATFRRWTKEQKEKEARARMERLANQQLEDMVRNPGRTAKEMAKAMLRPDKQLADLNQGLTAASHAEGGWAQAARSATAASKLGAFFAGLLAFLALVAMFTPGVNAGALMSASFAMMMSSATLALVESELYVKAAGEAESPEEHDRYVKGGAEAQVRAHVAIAGMGAAVAGGLIARIPLPGRFESVGGAVRHARNVVARNVGGAWAAIGKPTADKLREAIKGLRELFDLEARAIAQLRKQLDGMTHEQLFERLVADDKLRQALGVDADTAKALAAAARSEHGRAGARQVLDELRAALQTGPERARQQLEAALQDVERHAAAIEGAKTKDELDRALAAAEAELDASAVMSRMNEAGAQQTAEKLARLQGQAHGTKPPTPTPDPAEPMVSPAGKEPAPGREPEPPTKESPATRSKGEPSREPPKAELPKSWSKFEPGNDEAFRTRLQEFRGNDNLHPDFSGGEGRIFAAEGKPLALKRWFKSRLDDMSRSLSKLEHVKADVELNPKLKADIDVVQVREKGPDWILRDFDPNSVELKAAGTDALAVRARAIAELESLRSRSGLTAMLADLLNKLKKEPPSANLHWSPSRSKILVIDMQ